ncbi:MAG: sulfotransferase domain-containing protein [Reyranellaceae bacterium]
MERIAVYTCITNSYDELPTPPAWPGCDFICFTDNPYLQSKGWQIRPLPASTLDAARASRAPKILPHRFVLEYPISIWTDANVTFHSDLAAIARKALKDKPALFFAHPERQCLYEEAETCIRLGKDAKQAIDRQVDAYRAAGMPENAGLYQGTVLMRRHRDPEIVRLMEAWWAELLEHSRRDQIGLPYVIWRSGKRYETIPPVQSGTPLFERSTHHRERRLSLKRGAIKRSEIVVVSHPKSGRTWLREFLSAYEAAAGGGAVDSEFGPQSLGGRGIVFDHEFMEFMQNDTQPPTLMYPKLLGRKRLILLVRDPRSVVVSYYYHKSLRDGLQVGGLYDFVFSPMHGIERQAAFVEKLLDLYDAKRGDKLLLRYERLHKKPADHFRRFLSFVHPQGIDEGAFEHALKSTQFKAMQQREIEISKAGATGVARLGARAWEGDMNSLKTRKADLQEARTVFWPELWQEISGLANTSRLLQRLNYPA